MLLFSAFFIVLDLLYQVSNVNCDVIWLPDVRYLAFENALIDVSLPKIHHKEKCLFVTPENDIEDNLGSYRQINESSDFVSCRAIIGPVSQKLIGNWTVCGEYNELGNSTKRCQRVNISWINENNPQSKWVQINTHGREQSVNVGGYFSFQVSGSSEAVECHAITPYGEDLLLGPTSDYPGVNAATYNQDNCLFKFGPISDHLLGNWTIYGRFTSSLGNEEERRAVSLYYYDKDNPTSKPYNIKINDPITYTLKANKNISVEVIAKGGLDMCYFETPMDIIYIKNVNETAQSGGMFSDENGLCKINVGPIKEHLLGNWSLVGKFSDNKSNTEVRQRFSVVLKESPALTASNITVLENEAAVLSCKVKMPIQKCYLKAPNGTEYNANGAYRSRYRYVGEGLFLGDCSLLFPSLRFEDRGRWSCHVEGFGDENEERNVTFNVNIQELITLTQYVTKEKALIDCLAYPGKFIEYCTFVRDDGLGFTKFNIRKKRNKCELDLEDLSILNTKPWSVLAKVEGYDTIVFKEVRQVLMLDETEKSYLDILLYGSLCILLGIISMYVIFVSMKLKLHNMYPRKLRTSYVLSPKDKIQV